MSSGKVEASIANIVNDLPPVNWQQIIYEAITNAIQAKATEIKINFLYQDNTLDISNKLKYITAITVEDNGEGFTEQNTNSFKEYRTSLKKNLGCKGIGRFLFLKEFNEINIKSLDKKIKFVINSDIKVDKLLNTIDRTIIYFTQPKRKFEINYSHFEKDIKEHFIAYFKLLNDKNRYITLEVYENMDSKFKIHSKDIPPFETKEFKIDTHKFKMNYLFNNEEFQKEGFYCAGHRVVKKNSDLEDNRKLKLFKGFNILYLLEGTYLDNNINDTRDHFIINPKRTEKDLFHNLSWDNIQNGLREQIKIIAKENGLDIEKLSMENLKEAIEQKPYLGLYLKQNENFLDSETLVSHAEQALKKDKEFLRKHIHKLNKEEFYEKLSIVTQSELAEYIFDRQRIIEKLKSLTDDTAHEKEVHNLFMKKYTQDDNQNYRTNNLWLFDDRFMTYDKVFSEIQVNQIFPELSDNVDRLDLFSIVSNTYEKELITDIVIIELKRPDDKITPEGAEAQLLKYARYINQSNIKNKIRIWTYAFLKFNETIADDLDDKDYNQIPTQWEYPIYYKYHEKRNTIINFMDYRALAYDADIRNKTFMKILTGKTL